MREVFKRKLEENSRKPPIFVTHSSIQYVPHLNHRMEIMCLGERLVEGGVLMGSRLSGGMFNLLIEELGVARKDVYGVNTPIQVSLKVPLSVKAVLLMGNTAVWQILSEHVGSIKEVYGLKFCVNFCSSVVFIPTLHPVYLLRNPGLVELEREHLRGLWG